MMGICLRCVCTWELNPIAHVYVWLPVQFIYFPCCSFQTFFFILATLSF